MKPIDIVPLDIALFAHINNGYAISGTRKLEGRPYTQTIDYLNAFLKNNLKAYLAEESFTSKENEELENLKLRLASMNQASKELENLAQRLNSLGEEQSEEQLIDSLKEDLEPLISRIQKLNPKENSSVLMPGGWSGYPSGHAIAYEFKKDKSGNLIFMLYNSGAGLEFHSSEQQEDKIRYNTMKCYSIPAGALNSAWLSKFIIDLAIPRVIPHTNPNILPNLPQKYQKKYDAKFLYNVVFREVLTVGGKEINASTLNDLLDTNFNHELSMAQRSGTCTEQSLHELIKHSIPNKKTAKLVLFSLKLYSIESFLAQNTVNGFVDPKALLQLKIAVKKLSSSVLKKKEWLPPELYQKAVALINTISVEAEKPNPPLIHTQHLNINPIVLQNDLVNIKENFEPAIPIHPEESLQKIIEHPFNRESVNYANDAIDLDSFSLTKLKSFSENIKGLMQNAFFEDTEAQIFSYITNLPLEKDYFSAIDTPEKALQFFDLVQNLFENYTQASRNNQNSKLTPKHLVFLFSLLEVFEVLHSNPSISLVGEGFHIINFNDLKNRSRYNAHLSTNSLRLDTRLKEILEKKNPNSKKQLNLDALRDHINDKFDQNFKNHLEKLYYSGNKKNYFTKKEDQLIKEKGYEKAIAYLHYIEYENKVQENYKNEVDKVIFLRRSGKLLRYIQESLLPASLNRVLGDLSLLAGEKVVCEGLFGSLSNPNYLVTVPILNEDSTIGYYRKIQDPVIAEILSDDFSFCDSERQKANTIFSLANGKSNENAHSEKNSLYQRLRYLRVEPSLQFASTIDFFSNDNLEFFSVKKSGLELREDLKEYLRRNLFQVGLISKQCAYNPKSILSFNLFIDQALAHFESDLSMQLYFYQLQADVNTYVLDVEARNNPELAQIQTEVIKKQTSSLETLLLLNDKPLNAKDKYALSKLRLQLTLASFKRGEKVIDLQANKNLFNLFLQFSECARAFEFECAEQREAYKQLTQSGVKQLLNSEAHIYEWALETVAQDLSKEEYSKLEALKKENRYPYFYGINEKGERVFALDLTQGQTLISGAYFSYPPGGLINSDLGKTALEGRNPKMSVKICEDLSSKRLVKEYELIDSDPGERFFETYDANSPWVYQTEKTVAGKKSFYEKQVIHEDVQFLKLSLSVNRNAATTHSFKANLPEYFHGKETSFWLSVDEPPTLLIEQGTNKYSCDLNIGTIEELDSENQKTGFTLVFNQNPELFDRFESNEFTQFLFKADSNQIKIRFPRLGLALEGFRENDQWVIHVANKPNLRLVLGQTLMKPVLKNSLVFEDIQTKEQIVYTPNQYFYVNKKKEENEDENQFESVYYNPVLDTTNIHKRELLNFKLPELMIPTGGEPAAKGDATITGSEKYFTYTIDKTTGELKPKIYNSEAQLYLVYNHLIELNPEAALKDIQALLKSGALKGELGELEVIYKILKAAPEFAPQINAPEFIAIRAHLLYCLEEFKAQKKHFSIPDPNKIEGDSPDAQLLKKQYERLEKFVSELPSLTLQTLAKYNNIRLHIPSDSDMRLSSKMEYQLLRRSGAKYSDNSQIRARYLDLKMEFLRKEKSIIEDIKGPKNQDRLDWVEKKLAKNRHILTGDMHWGKRTLSFDLPHNRNSVNPNGLDIDSIIQNRASVDLSPAMSDEDFLKQFQLLYAGIKRKEIDPDSIQFLERMVQSSALAKDPQSLIPSWAAVLLTVAKAPEKFPDIKFEKLGGFIFNNLDKIFKIAKEINSSISFEEEGYVSKPVSITKKTTLQNDGHHLKFELIEVSDNPDYKLFNSNNFFDAIQANDFSRQVSALSQKTEDQVQALKDKLRQETKDKSYTETILPLSKCDEAIGKLKNKELIKIYNYTVKHFSSSDKRAAILDSLNDKPSSQGWISKLQDLSDKRLKTALSLANQGPSDPKALEIHRLELKAGQRKKLELSDLNRLFVLADKNEYRKVTGLSDGNIENLHNAMAQYMHFSILQNHYKNVEKQIKSLESLDEVEFSKPENKALVTEFGQLLTSQNQVSFKDTALQFFQKEEAIFIKPAQITAFNRIVEKNEESRNFNSVVTQLTMGAGKSKVITPTTALKKAEGSNLVIQQVKPSLLKVTYADLCEKFGRLFNSVPYLFTFERIPLSFERLPLDGRLLSERYKDIYNDLREVMLHKNFMLTDGVSLKSLQLQYRETLGATVSEADKKEWLKQIKQLDKLVRLIQDHGDRMIDEGHDELDPTQELNYTLGLPSSLPKEDLELHANLFFFFPNIQLLNIEGIEPNKTVHDLVLKNSLLTNPADQLPKVMESIAQSLMDSNQEGNPIQKIIQKLKAEDKPLMVEYLLNKSKASTIEDFLNTLSPREKDELAFIKFNLSKILPFTLLKNYNENYGGSRLPNLPKIKRKLAIPYRAVQTPNEKSRLGQPIEALNCTAQLNMIEPLEETLIEELIQDYIDNAIEERRFSPEVEFEQTKASLEFNRLFCKGTPITLKGILDHIKADNQQRIAQIVHELSTSQEVRKMILIEKAAPLVKINEKILSSDSQDLGGLSKTTQVMTATPFNYRTYHSDIKFDEIDNLGIEGETIEMVKTKNTRVEFFEHYDSAPEFLEKALNTCPQALEVRALIDVGGLFTKEKSNVEVAEKIGSFYKANPGKASKEIKFVLYFDNTNEALYAWDVKKGESIYLGSSDEKEIFKILNCAPDERFTYYDQARITGTDIVQGAYAHAFVTFSEKTLQSALLQGIKRLRQFSNNQSVTVVGPAYLKGRVRSNIDSVLDFTRKNQVDKCLQLHFKASVKKFKEIIRHDLLKRIYAIKDPLQKSQLYKIFESNFLALSNLHYFELYGQIDTELNSEDFFKDLESRFYKKWESNLQKANIPISKEEASNMQQELGNLVKHSVAICAKVTHSQPIKDNEDERGEDVLETEGLEVQNENEVTQELELEKNTTLYDESLKKYEDIDFVFQTKNYPLAQNREPLVSVNNSNYFLKNNFSPNLFVSNQQVLTLANGGAEGTPLKTYHNAYVKPIPVVMMIMPKDVDVQPKLQAVMLTANEAAFYTSQNPQKLNENYPNHCVWFVSPNDKPLYGTPPEVLPSEYFELLEQVQFIDGNLRKILQKKEFLWLTQGNVEDKMRFLKEKILPYSDPNKGKLFNPLSKLVEAAVLDNERSQKLATKAKVLHPTVEDAARQAAEIQKKAAGQTELEKASLQRAEAETSPAGRQLPHKNTQELAEKELAKRARMKEAPESEQQAKGRSTEETPTQSTNAEQKQFKSIDSSEAKPLTLWQKFLRLLGLIKERLVNFFTKKQDKSGAPQNINPSWNQPSNTARPILKEEDSHPTPVRFSNESRQTSSKETEKIPKSANNKKKRG